MESGQIREWATYQIVRCLGCETFGFRRNSRNTEYFYVDGDEMILDETEEIYPPRLAGRTKLKDEHLIPSDVRHIYDEAHAALVSEMPILSAVGIRGLIDAVCQDKEAAGKNLKEKIANLVNLGVLTQDGAGILQDLRLLGNESIHEMTTHKTRTLGTAFDVVENLLMGVYVIPAKARRLK